MRHKFYFGLLLIFFSLNTNLFAQNFWVPDANFRAKLKLICPSCFSAQDSLITNSPSIQNTTSLNIPSSNISSLDGIQFFTALSFLYCSNNQINNLPAFPASLITLFCDDNQLTSLPALPDSLEYLDCNDNQLTSLPALPASLEFILCYSNQMTSLPALPASLELLYCHSNQLTSLPALTPSLVSLDCSLNQLTSIPALPASLEQFFCFNNQLTSMPALGASLEVFFCYNNQLTSLPALPASLEMLWCDSNQLTSLPVIPGNIGNLSCSANPINCFPTLLPRTNGATWLSYIDISSTLITCIPNQIISPFFVIQTSQPLPFCSPSNNRCNYNYTSGYVFMDKNGNGIKDSFENGIPAPVYYLGNYGMWPDSTGFFNAVSDTGNITFNIVVPSYYTPTTPTSQTVQVIPGFSDTLYFGLQPSINVNDLKVDLTSVGFLRPGFKANYLMHFQNVGTITITNVVVKFLKPSALSNLSTLPAANLVSGDTLIWNIASLSPFQQGSFVITDSVFASAVFGDTVTAYAWIEPIASDTTPYNNTSISNTIIRGSYDPNDKSVSPEVVLPNATDYLEYTIRFQNTGTDTAFAVLVMDTLSPLLDRSSLEMISASHSFDLWVENGVVKWNFINILLPDSNTNEADSHGFVKFKMKPLPGLTITDSIPNSANIYFDFNAPVITNTIVVNVGIVGVKELKMDELKVFPNPVQESIRLVNKNAAALGKVELLDIKGNVLEIKNISTSSFLWNVQQLPSGTYILKGQGWGQKVVKE